MTAYKSSEPPDRLGEIARECLLEHAFCDGTVVDAQLVDVALSVRAALERVESAALAECERDHPPEPQYVAWCEAGCPDVAALERDLAAARQRIKELEAEE